MQNLRFRLFAVFGLCALVGQISCTKAPEEEPETPAPAETYPDKYIYTNAVFSMDEVPSDEPSSDIAARESRLVARKTTFFANLDNAIANGTLSQWLSTYHKEFTSETDAAEPYTVLAQLLLRMPEYTPALKPALVDLLRANIPHNIEVYETEAAKDRAAGYDGYPRDLNTVHPVRYALESAYALKLLDSYDAESEALVKQLIEDCVENRAYYFDGTYLTSGYNKEIFAVDIAFWVKMLYGDQPYPLTVKTFENVWTNVTVTSYDGDNSPHYDSTTGFYLILRWGLLLGREYDLAASPHIRRIMDRMAKTVMNSGQSGKFGKSMENLYSSNKELAIDGGRSLAWDLKVGYRLYNDPNYLYIARKYEDLRFNSRNVSRWKGSIYDLWPEGINCEGQTALPTSDFGTVHVTDRITSQNGVMLGRGDANYKTVQDKIILSTGRHPNSPSMLIDMSYTQSKAAYDHRIGITTYQFMSAHMATVLGRPGEPFRINRPMVAPVSVADFPVLKVAQGDVWPSSAYKAVMGYDEKTDYTIDSYRAAAICSYAACCDIAYTKFEYEGVSARRQVVLLNNGMAIVFDRLENRSGMPLNAAVTYNLWPSIEQQGERWVMQTGHVPTTVSAPAVAEIPAAFYFPQTATSTRMRVETDDLCSSFEQGKTRILVLESTEPLQPGETAELLALIVPVKKKESIGAFLDNIECEVVDEGYLLYLPSPADKADKIVLRRDGAPVVNDMTVAQ